MRFVSVALFLALTASPALAQRGPVIVIPGRPDVPVLMNGVNIAWSVVEGDFGLSRPGLVMPTVIYQLPPVILPYDDPAANERGYFPQTGKEPGYGRLEINPGPNRPLPPPAQSYRKSWSSNSASTPADLPSSNPTYIAPLIAPSFNGSSHHHRPWLNGSSPRPNNRAGAPSNRAPEGQSSNGPPASNGPPDQPPNMRPPAGQPTGQGPGNGRR
jgi:hypothetical protein